MPRKVFTQFVELTGLALTNRYMCQCQAVAKLNGLSTKKVKLSLIATILPRSLRSTHLSTQPCCNRCVLTNPLFDGKFDTALWQSRNSSTVAPESNARGGSVPRAEYMSVYSRVRLRLSRRKKSNSTAPTQTVAEGMCAVGQTCMRRSLFISICDSVSILPEVVMVDDIAGLRRWRCNGPAGRY